MNGSSYALPPRAGASLLVAASNAPDATKDRADFICTGIGDNMTIQAAIYALPADGEDRRGKIHLSEGDFMFSAAINVPGHVNIVGKGWGTKLIAVPGMNDYMIRFVPHIAVGSPAKGAEGIRIAYLLLNQNRVSQTAGGHIDAYGARFCVIEHCYFMNAFATTINFRALADGSSGQGNTVRYSVLDTCPVGIAFTAQNNCYIMENTFLSITTATVQLNSTTGHSIRNNSGLVTAAKGVAIITNAATSVVVTHGLSVTPNLQDIIIIPTSSGGSITKYWTSSVTSTTFTITANVSPGVAATFAWQVQTL